MQKEIILNNQKIPYTFRKIRKARHIKITIKSDASVFVSTPFWVSEKKAREFIQEKTNWILEKIKSFENKTPRFPRADREDYLKHKELAREIARKKLNYFNAFYGFEINKVFIRNQRTVWGSCSELGNLNFSYRIVYLSERLCDYIIVHELCHLGELNHSKKFWELVAKTMPDHKRIRKEIKSI